MKDYRAKNPNREYDEMFYADESAFTVDRVQAFKCPPNDDSTRWVPEKGYSVCVGGRLHHSKEGATLKLRDDAMKERAILQKRMAKIDRFLR